MLAHHLRCAFAALVFISASHAYAITGAQGGVNVASGERPARQEISTFQHAGAAFDLYILAMQQIMQKDQSDFASYFQVSGIHGYPHISWDNAVGQYSNNGYCPHASVLFPTWHRTYNVLFEQIISGLAQQIASTYPVSSKAAYQSAAATLRVPYWDWALNTTLPDVVNQAMINVNTPNGSQIIANPLYNYTFHPLPLAPEFPNQDVAKLPSSVRYPDSAGRSQPNLANAKLASMAASIRYTVYNLFTQSYNYGAFSNTGYSDGRNITYYSLEAVHNAMHDFIGGPGGHMLYVPFSSFDPVFWLHHANVDRIFAMWQAVYADNYVIAQVDAKGTYTNTPGVPEDASTALTPFRLDDAGNFHNSNSARSTRSFGYTYPELSDWNVSSTVLASDVKTQINTLYGPAARTSRYPSRSILTVDQMSHDYSIAVVVDGSDATVGMYVHFFLGSIPQEEALWTTAPSLVGSHIISGPSVGSIFGQIPLIPKLATLHLANLEPETVIPLVANQLNYRVQDFDGRAEDATVLPSLKFAVVGRNVTHLGPNEFPEYGPLITYTEATKSLAPHGLQEGESMPT